MRRLEDCRLYGILDLGYVERTRVREVAARMLEGGVGILQVRAKTLPEREVAAIAREVQPLAMDAGVPLILNDYPHLVPETGADGAHVGQDDLSVAEARELVGQGKIVGKSTHSVAQAVAAAMESPDYIGFGPLFATPTKPDYTPIGIDEIRRVHSELAVPIFCIGGIKRENLASVLAAGATRVVIVSGILCAEDIAAYCRSVVQMLNP
jgi:thiamine-phosphate pyrophosphorylase